MGVGRKPKPSAQKILHGNPGKRPINKKEPKFAGSPVCPTWLNKLAKDEWKRTIAALAELDMLKATDQAALASYCQAYARWRQAEEEIEREGQTTRIFKTNKGGELILIEGRPIIEIRRHPAVLNAKDANLLMLKSAALFGFDPSSRSRVQVPDGAETSPHEEDDKSLLGNSSPFNLFPLQ